MEKIPKRTRANPFTPTPELRNMVEEMVRGGIPQARIAVVLNIHQRKLRKHFRRELDTGLTKAVHRVANTLYQMAVSGNVPSATFFYLKCRAGWRDQDRRDQSLDLSTMTQEQLISLLNTYAPHVGSRGPQHERSPQAPPRMYDDDMMQEATLN